ncbi:hypothetical protein QO010_003546 [Caulobacter ginsengisoli]|uniref:SGNH/GDSL hydrolase family protein n=1 Tax=Caulobacter ginsengisoli TaxID=400775 RepID=A0ABU0IUS6_9CAUL|nr:hypothetical protein [Caulobacter ginsengisoli]MDQ0465754.1 hypothetical protein [Caulobacter ginsengisoli]
MTRGTQPLWSWALAAALAAAVLAGLAADPAGRLDANSDLNLSRLDRVATRETPIVVLIGSSKVQCGIGFDDELAARIRALGVEAQVVRITRQGAVYEDLRPAFERLATLRPALVLLEEDLVLYTHRRLPALETVSWRARAKRALRIRFGLKRIAFNDPVAGRAPCGAGAPPVLSAAEMKAYQSALSELGASSAADRAAYLNQLAGLRTRGARTVLIDVTRSPAAAAVFPERLASHARRTLAELARDPGDERLSPPTAFPQSAYADAGHLNAQGRRLYMAWLAPQIVRLIRTTPPGAAP